MYLDLFLSIKLSLSEIFKHISKVFTSKDKVKVVDLICKHPELSEDKVHSLTDMMKD